MPEGPEVRYFADELGRALKGKIITQFTARTKKARAWLEEHPGALNGRKMLEIRAYGKNLIGLIEGGYFFYSHQMMWGRWNVIESSTLPEVDRRERARIMVDGCTAILMSAPVFEIGEGDPFEKIEYLKELGPNALTYPGQTFDHQEFQVRLHRPENQKRTVGSVLLDQTVVAGLGNYLRAEIMFEARLNPWRAVDSLSTDEIDMISRLVPNMTSRAYTEKATIPGHLRERMRGDHTLVYVPGKEYGTRHYVFRRTNLPCLICGEKVRQLRQETGVPLDDASDDEEKTRIVYFCANCQHVTLPTKETKSEKLQRKALTKEDEESKALIIPLKTKGVNKNFEGKTQGALEALRNGSAKSKLKPKHKTISDASKAIASKPKAAASKPKAAKPSQSNHKSQRTK